MKKFLSLIAAAIFSAAGAHAQGVGINTSTPNATAALDVVSTTKGMLVPRMSTVQRNNIPTANSVTVPATGLMVYDTDLNTFCYYNGASWAAVGTGPGLQLFATNTQAQTKPLYAYGRYTFYYDNVVSGAGAANWTGNNIYTVPTGGGGLYSINALIMVPSFLTGAPPAVAPEIQLTRGSITTVYYGLGLGSIQFQGSTTDNTAGANTGPAGAPTSYGRGMLNLMLPLQAGDVLRVYFRSSLQSTSSSQTVSFSTDGSSCLSIVKMN